MKALMLCLVVLAIMAALFSVQWWHLNRVRDRVSVKAFNAGVEARVEYEAMILTVADPAQDFGLEGAPCYQPVWPCTCSCPMADGGTAFYHSEVSP